MWVHYFIQSSKKNEEVQLLFCLGAIQPGSGSLSDQVPRIAPAILNSPLTGNYTVVGNVVGVDRIVPLLAQVQRNLAAVVGAMINEVYHDLLYLIFEIIASIVMVFQYALERVLALDEREPPLADFGVHNAQFRKWVALPEFIVWFR